MAFKPEQPSNQERAPRSFWYTDEKGEKHFLEGTLESESKENVVGDGPRSFWYKDLEGNRQEVQRARSWFYEEEDEGESHARDFWKVWKTAEYKVTRQKRLSPFFVATEGVVFGALVVTVVETPFLIIGNMEK